MILSLKKRSSLNFEAEICSLKFLLVDAINRTSDDKDSVDIEVGQGILGGYGNIIEYTEAHCLPACGVVSWWSD